MLDGIKVLDFSSNAAGPTCTGMLADYGAEVVKIEKPVTGNDERAYGIQVEEGVSLLGAWLNRGKKSVTLNLKDPEAISIIKMMVKDFDVIVESARPGVMKKLGLDYDVLHAINPRAVYCSVSAFGQEGPYSKKPGYDIIAQAMSGLMYITGEHNGPPMKSGTTLSDYVGGINAFGSILAALRYAEKTGVGQHVDVSLLMSTLYLNGAFEYLNVGIDLKRSGNHHNTLAPYGLFSGSNGQSVVIAVISPKLWAKLCNVMNMPELISDERFDTLNQRRVNREELVNIIESWLKTFEDINVPAKLLEEAGIPSTKVFTSNDIINDPHILEEQYITTIPVPDNVTSRKTFFGRNCIAKFSDAPGIVKKAPYVGQDNYEVLGKYGMTKEEIDKIEMKWEN